MPPGSGARQPGQRARTPPASCLSALIPGYAGLADNDTGYDKELWRRYQSAVATTRETAADPARDRRSARGLPPGAHPRGRPHRPDSDKTSHTPNPLGGRTFRWCWWTTTTTRSPRDADQRQDSLPTAGPGTRQPARRKGPRSPPPFGICWPRAPGTKGGWNLAGTAPDRTAPTRAGAAGLRHPRRRPHRRTIFGSSTCHGDRARKRGSCRGRKAQSQNAVTRSSSAKVRWNLERQAPLVHGVAQRGEPN